MLDATKSERAAALSGDATARSLRFLGDAATHAGTAPEHVQTHISHVFLTETRAYKLKKPVTFSFLDFATLERREEACRREVEVNRLFAEDAGPGLYLGLRPILEDSNGRICFGALLTDPRAAPPQEGVAAELAVLDWVVEMRRFDRGGAFDQLAKADALTPAMLRALADRVAASHRAAPKRPPEARGDPPEAVIAQVEDALKSGPLADEAGRWARAAAAEAVRIGRRLAARRRHGFPRRLHGDLHLGNICLLDGAPTPFDAIEFNDRIAVIDPLYDVAFTVMDLLWREKPALAQQFISRYLGATRDYGGLAAWPLFLSLRAAIRAMTAALSGEPARARAKLGFAQTLLDRRAPPLLIAVGGLSGSGKSTLARGLAPLAAPQGGAVSIGSDEGRKRLLGARPEDRLRPDAYAPEVSERVYRRMAVDAGRALRAGASVAMDATFSRRAHRDAVRALAAEHGAAFLGLWLETPPEERLARVDRRAAAAERDVSDADRAVAAAQEGGLDPGEPGWRRLDAAADAAGCLARACALLAPRHT